MFGNVLGNCLYDKKYLADIKKIKVVPVSRPVRGFEIQDILMTRLTLRRYNPDGRNRSNQKIYGDGQSLTRPSKLRRKRDLQDRIR